MTIDPTTTHAPPESGVFTLGPRTLDPAHEDAVLHGAAVADADVAVVELMGPGTVACLQGLLTNDVEQPGPQAFVYGAVLTPKGMIVSDLWVARDGDRLVAFPPRHGLAGLRETFTRSLPPRLARPVERTADRTVLRVAGPAGLDAARRAGLVVPDAGRTASGALASATYLAARPGRDEPFVLQLECDADRASGLRAALAAAGAVAVGGAALELARIIAGWPRLGAEIGDKTLPQEVRYDEIDGVSYTKGCYTGQETVARVHFRGHVNRGVIGLLWADEPDASAPQILRREKTVGRVTSLAWVGHSAHFVGLGLVRREVEEGEILLAASAPARTTALPLPVV